MNKAKEPWYWDNLNAAIALTLIVAMIALCSLLAPDRPKKRRCTRMTIYQFSA